MEAINQASKQTNKQYKWTNKKQTGNTNEQTNERTNKQTNSSYDTEWDKRSVSCSKKGCLSCPGSGELPHVQHYWYQKWPLSCVWGATFDPYHSDLHRNVYYNSNMCIGPFIQPTFVHTTELEVKDEAALSCRGSIFLTCNILLTFNFCLYRALPSRFTGIVCVFPGVFNLHAEVKHSFSEKRSRVCQQRHRQ